MQREQARPAVSLSATVMALTVAIALSAPAGVGGGVLKDYAKTGVHTVLDPILNFSPFGQKASASSTPSPSPSLTVPNHDTVPQSPPVAAAKPLNDPKQQTSKPTGAPALPVETSSQKSKIETTTHDRSDFIAPLINCADGKIKNSENDCQTEFKPDKDDDWLSAKPVNTTNSV